jgi:hypothetical protein
LGLKIKVKTAFSHGVFQGWFSKPSYENLAFSSVFEAVNKPRKMAIHPCIAHRLLFWNLLKKKSSF